MPAAASILTLEIERLSLGGDGVAHLNGLTIFVPYAAPGDRLEVELTESRARYARARILRVVRASSERVTPPCPYHVGSSPPKAANDKISKRYCGGCSWQHLTYAAQLSAKRDLVQETLERIGGLRDLRVKPVLGMKEPWRYRNKVQQPLGGTAGHLISGFYSAGSHDIVPIEDCLVQPALSVALVNRARALLNEFHLAAYDDRLHRGWIRHLWARTSTDGKALLVFVVRTLDFPQESRIIATLLKEFPALEGIHQNVNPDRTNVILGRHWRKLAGADFIEERLGALRFRLSPASFFQVNTAQAEVLYEMAARMAGRGPRLLDLYSGVGAIALWLAGQFEEVGGIEEVRAAVEDAEQNAELNGIGNARFQAMPAEIFLRQIDRRAGGTSLTVTLDPPRAGCLSEVVNGLLRLRPRTIVYISCDPATLARDAGLLVKGGYRVQEVQPVDLFPHTPHIETAMKLTYGI